MHDEARQNPYAPPEAPVSDFPETSETAEPAGRGVRFGAAMIDMVLFIVAYVPLFVASGNAIAAFDASAYAGLAGMLTILLLVVLAFVTCVLVYRNGQTIGKKLTGIKVVRSDGSRASLARIFWLRNFVNGIPAAIPIIGNFYVIVDHLFIFGARRQCIHDLIADTIVVNA